MSASTSWLSAIACSAVALAIASGSGLRWSRIPSRRSVPAITATSCWALYSSSPDSSARSAESAITDDGLITTSAPASRIRSAETGSEPRATMYWSVDRSRSFSTACTVGASPAARIRTTSRSVTASATASVSIRACRASIS